MEIKCTGEQIPDRLKCHNHWPQFPCYDTKTRTCNSEDGVQLFDPVSDIWDGVSTAYLAVLDFAETLLRGAPGDRIDPIIEQRIRDTLNTWGPAFIGGPRPLLMSGDPVLDTEIPLIQISEHNPIGRYYTADDINEIVEAVPEYAGIVGNQLANARDQLVNQLRTPTTSIESNKSQRTPTALSPLTIRQLSEPLMRTISSATPSLFSQSPQSLHSQQSKNPLRTLRSYSLPEYSSKTLQEGNKTLSPQSLTSLYSSPQTLTPLSSLASQLSMKSPPTPTMVRHSSERKSQRKSQRKSKHKTRRKSKHKTRHKSKRKSQRKSKHKTRRKSHRTL